MHHILSKDERKTNEYSGPRKRLISPPEESHDAKKSMKSNALTKMTHSLNVTRPVKVAQSRIQNKGTEMFTRDNRTSLGNGIVKKKKVFTLITEQRPADAKACEKLHNHLGEIAHVVAAHVQKYNLTTATHAALKTADEGRKDFNKKVAVRTVMNSSTGDQNNGTSERVEGTVI